MHLLAPTISSGSSISGASATSTTLGPSNTNTSGEMHHSALAAALGATLSVLFLIGAVFIWRIYRRRSRRTTLGDDISPIAPEEIGGVNQIIPYTPFLAPSDSTAGIIPKANAGVDRTRYPRASEGNSMSSIPSFTSHPTESSVLMSRRHGISSIPVATASGTSEQPREKGLQSGEILPQEEDSGIRLQNHGSVAGNTPLVVAPPPYTEE